MTLTPMACLAGKFPNVVVEIAYENVTVSQLQAKLLRWMGAESTLQVAIGIKIYKHSRNHVAILHVRDEYKTEIDEHHEKVESQPQTWPKIVPFGNRVEKPQPLQFPLRALYYGTQIPSTLASHEHSLISIDLATQRSHIDARIEIQSDQKEEKKRRAQDAPLPAEPATKKHRQLNMTEVEIQLAMIQQANVAAAPDVEEGEPSWGPVVVCDFISHTGFREWLSTNKPSLQRCWYEPLDQDNQDSGRVVVYSLANASINRTANRVVMNIIVQVGCTGDRSVSKTLEMEAGPVCQLNDRDQQALTSLTPTELHGTNAFPNLVVEVENRAALDEG